MQGKIGDSKSINLWKSLKKKEKKSKLLRKIAFLEICDISLVEYYKGERAIKLVRVNKKEEKKRRISTSKK